MKAHLGRRDVLRAGAVWSGVTLIGGSGALMERLAAQACDDRPLGDLIGLVSLHGDRPRPTPFGKVVGGDGLDARLFTDLSRIQPERLITPADEMFVRTTAPAALRTTPERWTIATRGFAENIAIDIAALRRDKRPMGAHLIECSGNVDPDNFGLMSVTEWEGVPLAQIISPLRPASGATGLLVGGVDDSAVSRSSTPGASWILPLADLESLGAFLAVGMNGEPLAPDHGAPVRLVVPGWYGCSWIKWVNELRLVGPDEPVTSQMMEFSLRTHQGGVPVLARDYAPPVIDVAATPIRVEKRRVDARLEYRIVGIVWGGRAPVERLAIRFSAREEPKPFTVCPAPRSARTWSLWTYRWRPSEPGIYNIVLKVVDPTVRTRRLDVSFYVRRIVIDEV